MDGILRSYVPEKQYGFIDGRDGKSYFFHVAYFEGKQKPSDISEGLLVSFDPTPGPKGLQARSLRIAREHSILLVQPEEFVISKSDTPKKGKVFYQTPIIEVCASGSMHEAKNKLISRAANFGANAILNFSYRRTTGSSGNYTFTVHCYSGAAAVIMEERRTLDISKIVEGESEAMARADRLETSYRIYIASLLEQERKEKLKEHLMWWGIGAVIVVLFLAIRH